MVPHICFGLLGSHGGGPFPAPAAAAASPMTPKAMPPDTASISSAVNDLISSDGEAPSC